MSYPPIPESGHSQGMRARLKMPLGLTQLARQQAGVVSRQQALGFGLTPTVLARLVDDGRWSRTARGIYLMPATEPSWLARVWGGVLLGGPDARVAGLAAAALNGLVDDEPLPIEILIPFGQALGKPRLGGVPAGARSSASCFDQSRTAAHPDRGHGAGSVRGRLRRGLRRLGHRGSAAQTHVTAGTSRLARCAGAGNRTANCSTACSRMWRRECTARWSIATCRMSSAPTTCRPVCGRAERRAVTSSSICSIWVEPWWSSWTARSATSGRAASVIDAATTGTPDRACRPSDSAGGKWPRTRAESRWKWPRC